MLVWPNQISAWDSHKDSDMLITSRVVLLEKKSASVDVFCSSTLLFSKLSKLYFLCGLPKN